MEVNESKANRLRYSVSLVSQGSYQFYTLTMPSDVLARTCTVSTRKEDPVKGFQRALDTRRAQEIADYIDNGHGSIPNSIVLSAQATAELKVIGRGKTLEFNDTPGAFLILDGQHRVYGFSKAKKPLRVPVVIYNNLTRTQESRLFIDINTKQRAVPSELLLDIKNLANIEDESETVLRQIFDMFHSTSGSALIGLTTPFERGDGKITRVTFNAAVKPLLESFAGRGVDAIYTILNSYLSAVQSQLPDKVDQNVLGKPVVFRATIGFFPAVALRVQDKFNGDYRADNFTHILQPLFDHLPAAKLNKPGTSWVSLRDYFATRLQAKLTF